MKENSPGFRGIVNKAFFVFKPRFHQESSIMFYLGIDQHAKQLTIDLGDEEANLVDHRQVSTEWKPLRRFLSEYC